MIFEDENPEEPKDNKENEETTDLQKDKIFNNNYESTAYQGPDTNFQLSSQYNKGKDFYDDLEYEMSYDVIMGVLEKSPYIKLNRPDKEGNYKKLNKMQINEVYSYVVMRLTTFPRVQIFSIIQDYFDINSNKFYDSLSNTFKKELIEELRESGAMREKTGGPLF